jgi:hypothetical protein
MSNVAEIEAAIEKLPVPQVQKLADWFEGFLQRRLPGSDVENWLKHAKGAAVSGVRTEEVMNLTRSEE